MEAASGRWLNHWDKWEKAFDFLEVYAYGVFHYLIFLFSGGILRGKLPNSSQFPI
jgi:hypothetical protein